MKTLKELKKKILFFDGDGTMWYPKSTKRTQKPHWIYMDEHTKDEYLQHLTLTPSALNTVQVLKSRGYILILLSAHPHIPKEAQKILEKKMRHFELVEYFDEVYATQDYPEAKGEVMVNVLRTKNIPKSKALMIGDSYRYDYLSAKKVSIDALLIQSDYMRHPSRGKNITKTIVEISDILEILK